jgi:hypothetical protein
VKKKLFSFFDLFFDDFSSSSPRKRKVSEQFPQSQINTKEKVVFKTVVREGS